ncbi:hypothetical protein [Mycobacterium kansasii]|uniref:hypothetical protein n=1 Tax=Mycobacterium kansasii TaxID=1768 RepID=UPI003A8B26D3
MNLLTRRKQESCSASQNGRFDDVTPTGMDDWSPDDICSTAEPYSTTSNGSAPMLDDSHPYFLVPLAQLVAEGFEQSIDNLAKRLADAVLFNDVGQRCVTRATAASLFADRAAKQEIERRKRAEANAERRRRRAEQRQQRHEAQRATPPPRPGLPAALATAEYDPERW